MRDASRRSFLANSAGLACGFAVPGICLGQAAQQNFDVLIRGGTIVDPARGMQARADLGIRAGRISSIEPQLAEATATKVIDASGQYVTPALIDMHAQIYAKQSLARAPADEIAGASGITAWVSSGDVAVDDVAAFKQYCTRHTRCRIYGFLHFDARLAARGSDSDERIARELAQHRDVVLGLAVRTSDAELLERAKDILKRSQSRGRIACHVDSIDGADYLLAALRPGDIVTQPYRSQPNPFFDGKDFKASISAARNRGVIIDAGPAGAQFDSRIARAGLDQGILPDVISSGFRLTAAPNLVQPRLVAVMAMFMNLGLALDQVLAMTTINPARIIGREPLLGTLALGAPADIALLKISSTQKAEPRASDAIRIESVLTLRSGVVLPR